MKGIRTGALFKQVTTSGGGSVDQRSGGGRWNLRVNPRVIIDVAVQSGGSQRKFHLISIDQVSGKTRSRFCKSFSVGEKDSNGGGGGKEGK